MLKTIYQSTVIAAFGLMLLWLSLSGYFNFLQVSFGLVSTFFVVWFTYHLNLLTTDGARSQILRGYPLYLLWLTWEIIVSNILLAKIILAPKMVLHRQIVHTKANQSSDLAKAIYANSITLTPGTLTVDLNSEGFVVHSMAKTFTDDIRSDKMNDRVAKLEKWSKGYDVK